MDTHPRSDFGAVTQELSRLRKELQADINADLSDAIRQQLAIQVEPLGKRIADVKDLNVGLSRAVRDLQRPRQPQPSSPSSLLVQAAACHLLGMAYKQPAAEVAARRYGGSPRVLDAIASPGAVIARGVVSPATTTSVGWASELVGVGNYGAVTALAPTSVYARLAARGLRISLAGNGSVSIPVPTPTSDVAGVFVAEGEPAPVKSMSLASATLTPRKIALISHFSTELFEHSLADNRGDCPPEYRRRYRRRGGHGPARRPARRCGPARRPACRRDAAAAYVRPRQLRRWRAISANWSMRSRPAAHL